MERRSRGWGRVVRACGALALAVGSSPMTAAKDLDGILRVFASETDEAGQRARDRGHTLDLRYRRRVSSDLDYLFSVRTSASRRRPLGNFALGLERREERQIEPRFEIHWIPEPFELNVGFRRLERTDESAGVVSRRDENNGFAQFRTAVEGWPELLVEYDRRIVNATATSDTDNSRLLGQISYSTATWRGSLGRRRTVFETAGAVRRTASENLFAASYSRSFREGKLRIFGHVNHNDLVSGQRFEGEGLVPIPRLVAQAYAALDDAPEDGPLDPEPGLHDGNRSSPTRVNIGGPLAGGSSGWNLGVELPLEEPVDVVDVWLSDPIPLDAASRYRWEVYTGPDNRSWTLVTGSAARSYDPVDGRFRLIFPAVRARFVKVVNASVDDTLGAVFVSEIEAFGRELRRGETRSTTLTQTASFRLGWVPRGSFQLDIGGFTNLIENEVEGGTSTVSRDSTGSLALAFHPGRAVQSSVSTLYNRRDRTFAPDERELDYSVSLTALPFQDLDLTVVGNVRDRSRPSTEEDARSAGYLLRAATRLYQDLSLSFEFGRAHEESFETSPLERRTVRVGLDTRLREEIEVNSALLAERRRILLPGLRDSLEKLVNWRSRITFRPSSTLSLVAEGIYFRFVERRGWSRVLQADWFPLRGGALQFSVDYREDLPLFGQERTVRSGRLRWQIGRSMFLDFDGTRLVQRAPGLPAQGRTLWSLFYQARL